MDPYVPVSLVEKVYNKAVELCQQYPDAIYEKHNGGCSYSQGNVKNGPGCGCLIGQAVQAVSPELFGVIAHKTLSAIALFFPGYIHPEICTSKEYKITLKLDYLQSMQDRGLTWGKALASLGSYHDDN